MKKPKFSDKEVWTLDHDARQHMDSCYVPVDSNKHGGFAFVVWRMRDDERTIACEKRAQLLVAAPELLDMLEQAMKTIDAVGSINMEKARALIARAKGETL